MAMPDLQKIGRLSPIRNNVHAGGLCAQNLVPSAFVEVIRAPSAVLLSSQWQFLLPPLGMEKDTMDGVMAPKPNAVQNKAEQIHST